MAISYHNIAGSSGLSQELIAPQSNVTQINSIYITNTHDSDAAEFSLFLQDDPESGDDASTNTYYLIKKLSIPAQSSLTLENKHILSFDNNIYGLYITVASGDTIDIIIG
mgnify:CR=1 FL=1